MKLLKKNNKPKTKHQIINDLKTSYEILIREIQPKSKIFNITLTYTGIEKVKSLRHKLTNNIFNRLHKTNKDDRNYINYLFVIEYSEVISKGDFLPTKVGIHSHIVLNTTLPIETIKTQIKSEIGGEIFWEDITNRNDKENFINYLTKQSHILTIDNYNYKIDL